ncbi:hypothetical protein [Streptomyces erythrochromogenes]|uniref:hypothetical protein n=1 Tax=Streptomyces erythrochromogenes TaxID=285574 RepID=UPI003803C992
MPFIQFRVEAPGRAGMTAVPFSYCSAAFGSGATERKPAPAVSVTVALSTYAVSAASEKNGTGRWPRPGIDPRISVMVPSGSRVSSRRIGESAMKAPLLSGL